jgi:hypothetical protein
MAEESGTPPQPDGECLAFFTVRGEKTGKKKLWLVKGRGVASDDLVWVTLTNIPITRDSVSDKGLEIFSAAKRVRDPSPPPKGEAKRAGRERWELDGDGGTIIPLSALSVGDAEGGLALAHPARVPDAAGESPSVPAAAGKIPAAQAQAEPVDVARIEQSLEELATATSSIRTELSAHRNAAENELHDLSKRVVTLIEKVSWMERGISKAPPAGSPALETANDLAHQLQVLAAKSDTIGARVAGLRAEFREEVAAGGAEIRSSLTASSDEIIASTTKALRSALPDLNRRFSDAQAVLIRLDRSIRRMLEDFDGPADLREAVSGQLDDHLREAGVVRIESSATEAQYLDVDTQRTL